MCVCVVIISIRMLHVCCVVQVVFLCFKKPKTYALDKHRVSRMGKKSGRNKKEKKENTKQLEKCGDSNANDTKKKLLQIMSKLFNTTMVADGGVVSQRSARLNSHIAVFCTAFMPWVGNNSKESKNKTNETRGSCSSFE